jgi:HPt (histidine-containing phosphotransfer) domain-containing protein
VRLQAAGQEAAGQEAAGQEAADEAGGAVLDQAVLDKIRAVDRKTGRNVLSKVIGIYLAHTPGELETLGAAVAQQDAAAVAKLAHGLKSSNANLGAQMMAGLLKDLEHRGRSESLDEAPTLLAQIEAEFERVRLALEAELPADSPLLESA